MRILLAGGAGYVGSLLAPTLQEYGYEVSVIDLLWFGNHLPKEINVIKKDLFDCKKEDFQGYDQMIFLGGLSNDPMAQFNPAMNFIYNGAQPSYLAYIAKSAGVKRFIYASSSSVYGHTKGGLYDEESPAACIYPYGISKLQGERGAMQTIDDKFSVIALRQAIICGHSPRMRFDGIVNTMYKSCMTEGKITINNASIWQPIIDIRDIVSAYMRAIQADNHINGVFNIASGNYTVGQIGETVKEEVEALTEQKIAIEIKQIPDIRNYKITWQKATNLLGYEQKYKISDSIIELHKHIEEYGDLEQDSYYNVEVFKKMEEGGGG